MAVIKFLKGATSEMKVLFWLCREVVHHGGEGTVVIELTTPAPHLLMMYPRNESNTGTQKGLLGVRAFLNIGIDQRVMLLVQTDRWTAHTAHLQAGPTRLSQTCNWFFRIWFQNKGGASGERRWGSSSC